MQPNLEQVRAKLDALAPEQLAEVETFIDFLQQRRLADRLRSDFSQASQAAFAEVWDNDEDAIYDTL